MTDSPFKFLDAYDRADKAQFFGRDAEVEELYRLVFQTSLVLVYGTSGTGKTSLIQCGLANRFQPTDWFELFVRRGDDINASLDRAIRARADTAIPDGASVVDAVQSLYLDHLRPVYLIFDQFEELFIMGTVEEQQAFFDTVAAVLATKISCKIIISMREEYLARLHQYEKTVPSLFAKRLRVEAMSMANVEAVIMGTTAVHGITLENGAATAQAIITNLDDNRVGVQLAYLQIYLDKLYRLASEPSEPSEPGDPSPVTFTDADVAAAGKLGDIMADFLGERTTAIQAQLTASHPRVDPTAAQHILEAFVTVEGTKQPTTRAELGARLPALEALLDEALAAFQHARILRVADGRAELAHDSLARHITDRRSEDRKIYAQVEKIVRDRLAAYPQTRSLMNAEELAVVGRSRAKLELSERESKFVDVSASKMRWRKVRRVAIVSATGLVLLVSTFVAIFSAVRADETLVRTARDIDDLTFETYTSLQAFDGPEIGEIRTQLLRRSSQINRNAGGDKGDSITEPEESGGYWEALLKADLDWEAGDRAAAATQYRQLADVMRTRLDVFYSDLDARVKLRNLLWRLAAVVATPAERNAVHIELIALSKEVTTSELIDFSENVPELCGYLIADGGSSPDCPPETPTP
jgi:hypothetical protein